MMQGYTISSRYDSEDYDDLLALSCDACSEEVRQNLLLDFLRVVIHMEPTQPVVSTTLSHIRNCYS